MNFLSLLIALLVFCLMIFGVKFEHVNIEAVGWFFFALAFLLPGGWGLPTPKGPNQ